MKDANPSAMKKKKKRPKTSNMFFLLVRDLELPGRLVSQYSDRVQRYLKITSLLTLSGIA
jgi:hypothetical protein